MVSFPLRRGVQEWDVHCRADIMTLVHPSPFAALKLAMLCLVSLAVPEARAQGDRSQGADLGRQAQAKIHINVSVRPASRVRPLSAAPGTVPSSLCLWSNLQDRHYAIKASWSDGRAADIPMTNQAGTICGTLAALRQAPPGMTGRNDSPMLTLLIAPE
jgi:hypothetical protein